MLNIAVCDDSRTDVEMLESAFDKLAQYQFSYEVYFTAKELLKHVIHIRVIEGDEVVMDNEERLLIARSHKQNLKEKHMEFVRRMV